RFASTRANMALQTQPGFQELGISHSTIGATPTRHVTYRKVDPGLDDRMKELDIGIIESLVVWVQVRDIVARSKLETFVPWPRCTARTSLLVSVNCYPVQFALKLVDSFDRLSLS